MEFDWLYVLHRENLISKHKFYVILLLFYHLTQILAIVPD